MNILKRVFLACPDTKEKCNQYLSIKGRLVVLLIVMLLPFVGFSVFKALDIRKGLEDNVRAENQKIARSIAHDVDEYINSTGEVLIPIAKHKDVRIQNYAAVNAYLQQVVPQYPFYSLIAFVDVNGNVRAAAMSDVMAKSEDAKNIQVSVKETACYRRGINASGIAVGDFMYSKLTGMPVLHVTYPVDDLSGKRIGFIAAAFDLTKIQNKLMRSYANEHIVLSVIDEKGIYIARSRDPKKWVGKDVSKTDRFKAMAGKREGTYTGISADKTQRIFGFAVATKVPWYVRAGVDYSHINNQVKDELIMHFATFLPLLLVALFGWFWVGRGVDRLHNKTEVLSLVDPLTELWNCRKLDNDFAQELIRARRYHESLSFMMIDIDHFKTYNDTNGHQAGDEALCTVARIIRHAVRDIDTVYRYGGEELCILMPSTERHGALALAERIRSDVEKAVFPGEENQPSGRLTISAGVATYPLDSISREGLIKSADIALYRAKENGRNKVVAYGDKHWIAM